MLTVLISLWKKISYSRLFQLFSLSGTIAPDSPTSTDFSFCTRANSTSESASESISDSLPFLTDWPGWLTMQHDIMFLVLSDKKSSRFCCLLAEKYRRKIEEDFSRIFPFLSKITNAVKARKKTSQKSVLVC